MKTFIIEVEKAINWNAGYLNEEGNVTENINDAKIYEDRCQASDDAVLFNVEFGKNGKIYARVNSQN